MGAPARSIAPEVLLKEHLLYVHTKAEAGEYADAMTALRETRASITDNVYLGALEKQLRQLIDLSEHRTLTEDQRSEILEPLTAIIEKAIGSVQQEVPVQPTPPPLRAIHLAPTVNTEERQQALDRLKVQYFEQASRHLSAGEYDLALSEIRRVFVIDPDNSTARQYESVIGELMRLKPAEEPAEDTEETPEQTVEDYERSMEQVSIIDDRIRPGDDPSPPKEEESSEVQTPAEEEPEPASMDIQDHTDAVENNPTNEPGAPDVEPEDVVPIFPLPPVRTEPVHVFTHSRPSVQTERPRMFTRGRILALCALLVLVGGTATFMFLRQSNGDSPRPNIQLPVQSKSDGIPTTTSSPIASSVPIADNSLAAQTTSSPIPEKTDNAPENTAQSETERPLKQSRDQAPDRDNRPQPIVAEEVAFRAPASNGTKTEPEPSKPVEAVPLTVPEPEPEPFIAVEKDPQLAHLVQPQIPDLAWQTSSEASIVVRVLIDAEGKPVKTRTLKSTNAIVETAVVSALMQSTFTPGIMGKSAVTSWLTVPLKFKRGG